MDDSMNNYMLAKLEAQILQSIAYQNAGDYSLALDGYEHAFEALYFYEKFGCEQKKVEHAWRLVLEAQTHQALVLFFHGLIQYHRSEYRSAAAAAYSAILLKPEVAFHYFLLARSLNALADYSGAQTAYERAEELAPGSGIAKEGLFSIACEQQMPGDDYYAWLQHFHQWLKPADYVEIGIGHGRSLALAGPGTKTIGIDPFQGYWEKLDFVCPHGPAKLFPLTSDDFFRQYDLREVLGRDTFDLAFIDGMHLFEQALKDFINLEKYARKDSVILIHDCLPIAPIVAERERCTGFWTGDVWRIIPCLKAFRPDLKIMTIPAKPSGLGVVTNLDPTSTALSDNYDVIVGYYLALRCPERFDQQRVISSVGLYDEEYVKTNFCSMDMPTA
ncbi:MAG: hypothetical protein A2X82_05980 [Geobacteraceae bacterium GWC2_55_20]|nr:MAG: hypothetical protein A2X82_05980 [Geobacteraceae bacterium GWC2_55_20]HBA72463.1 hypothetical protein [Geobacter sp.]HCE66611.1 hypothetical protein [Geobacter sp.]